MAPRCHLCRRQILRFFNRLYRNNRDGTFTDVTQKAGVQGRGYEMGVAVGDYNNDGLEDLYVVGVHGNTLYRNNGDGTFTDVTQAAGVSGTSAQGRKLWSVAAAWVDYDNDGHLDLIVSNYCDWTPGEDPICGGLNDARPLPIAIRTSIGPSPFCFITTTGMELSPTLRRRPG